MYGEEEDVTITGEKQADAEENAERNRQLVIIVSSVCGALACSLCTVFIFIMLIRCVNKRNLKIKAEITENVDNIALED